MRISRLCLALLHLFSIGAAPLAAANLVVNGGFTDPATVTAPTPPITVPDQRIPAWVMSGEWFVDLAHPSPEEEVRFIQAASARDRAQQLSQQVYLEPGRQYTLSAWLHHDGMINSKLGSQPAKAPEGGILITNWDWTTSFRLPLPKAGETARQKLTFTAPPEVLVAGLRQPCQIRIYRPTGEKGTLWAGGFQLEEGKRATSFRPVSQPEVAQVVERLQGLAERVETSLNLLKHGFAHPAAVRKRLESAQESLGAILKKINSLSSPTTAEWNALQKELLSIEESAEAIAMPFGWWENPWKDLPKQALPEGDPFTAERSVKITLAQNDYGAVVLAFANLSPRSLAAEVSTGEPVAPFSTLSRMDGPVKVSSIMHVSNEGFRSNIRKQGGGAAFPYHLNPLGNANTFLMAGGETAQLWFDISTAGLKAGEHRFPIKITGLEEDYEWRGEIVVEVLPLELPSKVPANVIAYAGEPFFSEPFSPLRDGQRFLALSHDERRSLAEGWLKAWQEMGFNRVMLTSQMVKPEFTTEGDLAAPLDFSRLKAFKALFDSIEADYWGGYSIARYHLPQEVSPAAEKRVRAYLEAFVAGARELGLTPESYPLNMYDEPHGRKLRLVEQATRVLREVAPSWRTISTASGSNRARMEPLLPWVDIFVVRQRMGEMDLIPDAIEYLRSQGKEVWGYACSGSWEYTHPYRYYRLLAWQAWSNDLNGYGIYMSMSTKRFQELGPRAAFYSPLFYGKDGPVYSKAARAFQLAGRDWCILSLARTTAQEAAGKELGKESAALLGAIKRSVETVLKEENTPEHADKARTELLHQTLQLRERLERFK